MEPKIRQCIEECSRCYQSCVETMAHCLKMGGKHNDPEHQNLLKDCAEICKLSENFMLRGSKNHKNVCQLCADICEQCATSCEQVDSTDDQMTSCAQTCRQCAEICQSM